jgi:hypothetical protein
VAATTGFSSDPAFLVRTAPPEAMVIVPPLLNVPLSKFKFVTVNADPVLIVTPVLFIVKVFNWLVIPRIPVNEPDPSTMIDEVEDPTLLPAVRLYIPLILSVLPFKLISPLL